MVFIDEQRNGQVYLTKLGFVTKKLQQLLYTATINLLCEYRLTINPIYATI